jgi:hypothetical protein
VARLSGFLVACTSIPGTHLFEACHPHASDPECLHHAVLLCDAAGSPAALYKLRRLLPEHWTLDLSVSKLQMLLDKALAGPSNVQTVSMLTGLLVAAQLSKVDVLDLLTRTMPRASRVSSEAKGPFGHDRRSSASETAGMSVLRLLLDLAAAQQLSTSDMMALLRCRVSHGLVEVTRWLLDPSVQPNTAGPPGNESRDAN